MFDGFKLEYRSDSDYSIVFSANETYYLGSQLQPYFNGLPGYPHAFKFSNANWSNSEVVPPEDMTFEKKHRSRFKLEGLLLQTRKTPSPPGSPVRYKHRSGQSDLAVRLVDAEDNEHDFSELGRTTVSLDRQPTGVESGRLPRVFAARQMGYFLRKLLASQATLSEAYALYLFYVKHESQLQYPILNLLRSLIGSAVDSNEAEIVMLIQLFFRRHAVTFQEHAITIEQKITRSLQDYVMTQIRQGNKALLDLLTSFQQADFFSAINGNDLTGLLTALLHDHTYWEIPGLGKPFSSDQTLLLAIPVGIIQGVKLYWQRHPEELSEDLIHRLSGILSYLCFDETELGKKKVPQHIDNCLMNIPDYCLVGSADHMFEQAWRLSDMPQRNTSDVSLETLNQRSNSVGFQAPNNTVFFNSVNAFALQAVRYDPLARYFFRSDNRLASLLDASFSALKEKALDSAPLLVAILEVLNNNRITPLAKRLYWVFAFRINKINRTQLIAALTNNASGFDKWFAEAIGYNMRWPKQWLRKNCPSVTHAWLRQFIQALPKTGKTAVTPLLQVVQYDNDIIDYANQLDLQLTDFETEQTAPSLSQRINVGALWKTMDKSFKRLNKLSRAVLSQGISIESFDANSIYSAFLRKALHMAFQQIGPDASQATQHFLAQYSATNPFNRSAFWQLIFLKMQLAAQIMRRLTHLDKSPAISTGIYEKDIERLYHAYCAQGEKDKNQMSKHWHVVEKIIFSDKKKWLERLTVQTEPSVEQARLHDCRQALMRLLIQVLNLEERYSTLQRAIRTGKGYQEKCPLVVRKLLVLCQNKKIPIKRQSELVMELTLLLAKKTHVLNALTQTFLDKQSEIRVSLQSKQSNNLSNWQESFFEALIETFNTEYSTYESSFNQVINPISDNYKKRLPALLFQQVRAEQDRLLMAFASPVMGSSSYAHHEIDALIDADTLQINVQFVKKLSQENPYCAAFLTDQYIKNLIYLRDWLLINFSELLRQHDTDRQTQAALSEVEQVTLRYHLCQRFKFENKPGKAFAAFNLSQSEKDCLLTLSVDLMLANLHRLHAAQFRLDLLKDLNRTAYNLIISANWYRLSAETNRQDSDRSDELYVSRQASIPVGTIQYRTEFASYLSEHLLPVSYQLFADKLSAQLVGTRTAVSSRQTILAGKTSLWASRNMKDKPNIPVGKILDCLTQAYTMEYPNNVQSKRSQSQEKGFIPGRRIVVK